MALPRFFVTSVLALVTAVGVGCTSGRNQRGEFVSEGNDHLTRASAIEAGLSTRYGMNLEQKVVGIADFGWSRRSKAERQAIKENLAELLTHSVRVLELDAKAGIYVTNKEVLEAKVEHILVMQKSLRIFESKFGENYDPKGKKNYPAPHWSQASQG